MIVVDKTTDDLIGHSSIVAFSTEIRHELNRSRRLSGTRGVQPPGRHPLTG